MPRITSIKVPGSTIPIPKDTNRSSWKVIMTDITGTDINVTTDLTDCTISRLATDGVSNFNLMIDNTEGKYKGKFRAGLKVDIYYDFKEYSLLSTIRFRGYLDGVFDNFDGSNGFTISVEGRDCPKSSTNDHFVDTHITLQFTARNNLDCWYGVSGVQDSNGNYENSVLYNSGLKFQVYDTADKTWKVWDDLTTGQRTTIKAQAGYTQSHTNNYVDTPRLTISKELANEGDYDFYIYYDSGTNTTYLRVHPEEAVENINETITAGQNLFSIARFGKDTGTEINRFKQSGFTDSNILLMRTKQNTARQSALWTKDREETSNSLTTDTMVSNRATAKVNELKEAPNTGSISVDALPTLQPGEKVNVQIPYIYTGLLKVKNFTVSLSSGEGIVFSMGIQDKETRFEDLFKDRIDENVNVLPTNNPNGMKDSFVYDFGVDTEYFLTDCQIVDSVLSLTAGSSEGTMITISRTLDTAPSYGELRIKSNQAKNCDYFISVDGGNTYQAISVGTLFSFTSAGINIVLKVVLREATAGVSPEFSKICVMFR